MKKEKDRRSQSRDKSEDGDGDNSNINSPDGSPTRHHNHRHHNQRGSDNDVNRNQRQSRSRQAAADQRRTQSERRATSRQGHGLGSRPLNPHVRAVRETAILMRKQVKVFKREYLGPGSRFDFPACSKCLEEEVLPGWGLSSDEVKDHEKFLKLTLRRETDENVIISDQYMDLLSIAKRARDFETVMSGCRRQLQDSLDNHAAPHLVSLKHMLPSSPNSPSSHDSSENGDNVLHSVEEYDTATAQQAQAVEQKLADLGNAYTSYKDTVRPFAEYVRNGETHSSLMGQCCTSVLEVCKMLEAWAQGDHGYPESLVRELEEKKRLRDGLQHSLRQVGNGRYHDINSHAPFYYYCNDNHHSNKHSLCQTCPSIAILYTHCHRCLSSNYLHLLL